MNKYDLIPAVRRSDLWELRKSPAHYLYKVTHEEEATPALTFGTAAHKYILEPELFLDDYMVAPEVDRRTKAGKEQYAEFLEQLGERQPIKKADFEVIQAMNDAILMHPTACDLLKHGMHEVPITWTDPDTDEECKCRPDVINTAEGLIVDYKTTTSCEDGAFERSCRYYGYKLQAAMYTEGLFQSQGLLYRFAFVAQEKTPPYAVRVYMCDPGFVDEGMEQFRDLMKIYHECKQSGKWPGYTDKELIGDE